jgi:(p)ppGpp synthase/HD superfamily hydrolase
VGSVSDQTAPEPDLSFADRLPLTRAAIQFASERHGDQRRRADEAPFVFHPIEAASLLERSRYPDHVVAAAVLHDVLEDTDVERADLEAKFGADVADLVATVSDDPSIEDPEEQKADTRERVRSAGGYAPAVFAADKISKVRELRTMMARGIGGDEVQAKRARYGRSLAMLETAMPGSRLVELLRFELEALDELPPEGGSQASQ